ncbi:MULTISPECIES: M4 family metallopeptidase [unclassified Lysobacter]|uniref:M4 family metallopeptidase n=1 Tax=unclassified Lysobacter TaxID=2635362 RepID=UPI001BE8AE0A|nr:MULTISPECIES: M4 family metallopeptidase [unclassified Lysobacter]MBT2746997.1 M4 family metallopeptidase [Lysobacter sp. ISL-42]MBT2750541.1 M4 family metallopeptidase [Lysobacter sp. ISL-50]MBT2776388.1 M4 family metallopeptidase [Lysobacter sp. ISL-54]MBT2780882.1 M4 family metallopeptidase [Lysobacter sp. ISL-52]
MQLKTAVLSTAVVAALVALSTQVGSGSGPTQSLSHQTSATAPSGVAATNATAPAIASAVAPRHSAFGAIASAPGARPGSDLVASSESPAQADASPAAHRARGLLSGAAAQEVHRVQADAFVARDVMIDRDGTEHVRMERSYLGLPVVGGDFVVHSQNGELKSITQGDNMRTFGRPDIAPKISAEQARIEAGAAFDGTVTSVASTQLVVFARAVEPTLAYQVDVLGDRRDDPAPGNISYFIDARNGALLQEDDRVHSAAANGTGRTLTLGNVGIVTNSVASGFQMTDPSRGSGQTLDAGNRSSASGTVFSDADNTWGNNTTSDRASAATDAHYGVAATWDYYKSVHGRNGIFNDGKGVKSFVHYGPTNLVNAYWDGSAMLYGDGDGVTYRPLVALDVAGHEMTHGVTGATARLGYYNIKDSGGINEGISDIFGTLVEFSVANANDPGDYLIGEEIYISNPGDKKALRVLFKQDADGRSKVCYPSGGFTASQTGQGGTYDPHYTSGVLNRVNYLASEGVVVPSGFSYTKAQLVCNTDTTIVGIGRDKVGAIFYRALTRYFVSSTTYPQARTWTLQAAGDLYGSTSNEYKILARAWSAASVN